MFEVAVVVVGFRNADDIVKCLSHLAKAEASPKFSVFICENGGPAAMANLRMRLAGEESPCVPCADVPPVWPTTSLSNLSLALQTGQERGVFVAEAPENLGYAGGVNFWLRPLLLIAGWDAVWVLNPDTAPAPDALAALARFSRERRKGMVGSCIVLMGDPDSVVLQGLRWRKLVGKPAAIGRNTSRAGAPDPNDPREHYTAPSGASVYVTRDLIGRIGLMEDSYFLYYEDVEWGDRAGRIHELGYAHDSIVEHQQGTTIGGASDPIARSPISVYLGTRNTILFVRRNYPFWLAWTVLVQFFHVLRYVLAGSLANAKIGLQGLVAGIRGESGRPDPMPRAGRAD